MDDKLRPGSAVCQCGGCGQRFGSVTGFDRHRVGPPSRRRCLTPAELAAIGLVRDLRGVWRRPFRMPLVSGRVGLAAAEARTGDA